MFTYLVTYILASSFFRWDHTCCAACCSSLCLTIGVTTVYQLSVEAEGLWYRVRSVFTLCFTIILQPQGLKKEKTNQQFKQCCFCATLVADHAVRVHLDHVPMTELFLSDWKNQLVQPRLHAWITSVQLWFLPFSLYAAQMNFIW